MTRLFLRFYLGVVLILISAWAIQSYVFRQRTEAENIRVVEQALSGGARLARDILVTAPSGKAPEMYGHIQQSFEYPVQFFGLDAEWLPENPRNRLVDGEVVFLGSHVAIAAPQDDSSSPPDSLQGQDSGEAQATVEAEATTEAPRKKQATAEAQDLVDQVPPGDESTARDQVEVDDTDRNWGLLFGPLPQFVGPSQTEITFGYGGVFILAAIGIAVLLRPVASQFRAVEQTAAAIAGGDLSARIDPAEVPKDLTLVRAFNSMADRTETMVRTQRELLQAVSHELRTPLARIRFATDLVESAQTDEDRRSRLDAIDSATEKLDDLVGELLTYVRLESDPSEAMAESIDLQSLFLELIDMHAPLYPAVSFQADRSPEPIQLRAHRDSLSRAIENLLRNAGRYARQHVRIGAIEQSGEVVIHVDDDGPGIPEADREKVLEPFVRLEDEASERGSGLGLALVNRIATRHGGRVRVNDSPLGGARFSLFIPTK